jgi:SAM-dependent methyltransferase
MTVDEAQKGVEEQQETTTALITRTRMSKLPAPPTSLPGKEIALYDLTLWCDMGVGIGGDRWPAAELFCELILDDQFRPFFRALLESKSVLELGAGNGMVGILVGKHFAPASVVVSDLEDHHALMVRNVAANAVEGVVEARVLDWTRPHEAGLGQFDVVLALECIYREFLYQPLIEAFKAVCRPTTVIFLGLTRHFAKPAYFDQLEAAGFDYRMVPHEVTLAPAKLREGGSRDVGLFVVTLRQPPRAVA